MDISGFTFMGNTAKDYALFGGVVAVSIILALVVRAIIKRYLEALAKRTKTKIDDVLVSGLLGPAGWIIILLGLSSAKEGLNLSESVRLWTDKLFTVLTLGVLFVVFLRLFQGVVDIFAESVLKRANENADEATTALNERNSLRVTRQVKEVGTMVIFILAALTVLSNLGIDVKAIWASLGIGGIAIVVAVKDPLTNIVGRLYIFSTGIFDEGHFIAFDNWSGTVKKIGVFRTTVELFSDMTTVTIPNAQFVQKPVKNFFGRTKFMYKWGLDVPYAIPAERVEGLVEALKEHILSKEEVNPDATWIYLEKLDKYSKVVRVWFQASLPDWGTSLHYGSKTLGEIQRIFAEKEIEFAFPTQTVNVEGFAAPVEE